MIPLSRKWFMKLKVFVILISLLSSSNAVRGQASHRAVKSTTKHSFSLTAINPTSIWRRDELVGIDLAKIKTEFPLFNEKAFLVIYKNKEVPSQLSEEPSGYNEHQIRTSGRIEFVSSFGPREKKRFRITWKPDTVEEHVYSKMTQAALGVKVDYEKVNGYYTGGRFVDFDSTTEPSDHFAHDALYRIEGPGWESDKIVYRFYLDSRNRNDIFGKKTPELVLRKIGQNDLVSDGKESYANMLDWGMDIFKVGESLGIGSIAMWHDSKVVTVSDVEKVKCSVFNGPLRSGVFTRYNGWKAGGKKYDLFSNLSISAGSRLTRVCTFVNSDSVQLCTGLARHDGCDLLESAPSENKEWAYVALYGKQSLSGDNLGIAILYRKSDEMKLTEDGTSEIVVFRPVSGNVTYYFGAAWEQEPNGIKNEGEFKGYLDSTLLELSEPIQTCF